MWRHTLVILSNVECARNSWSDVQTPPPPPLNSNLTFGLRNFLVKVWGVWHQTPPPTTTTPKLQLDLENFLVKVWSGGGGGGMSGTRPPPPTTTPKLQPNFLDLENFLVKVWGCGGGGVWCQTPPTTTPKLNSTFLDLQKWLFMPEICDDILLLPMGNYSFSHVDIWWKINASEIKMLFIFPLCNIYLTTCNMMQVLWPNVSWSGRNLSLSNMPWVFYLWNKCTVFPRTFLQNVEITKCYPVTSFCDSLPKVHQINSHWVNQGCQVSVAQ